MLLSTLLMSALLVQDSIEWSERELKIINSLSPSLDGVALPSSPSNRFADDPGAAALGQKLFFASSLSPSGTISCASCHDPEIGWGDGLPVSRGAGENIFNAPTVLNSAHGRWKFWDGRSDSLWSQALQPIEGEVEMNSSRTFVLHEIVNDSDLSSGWEAVFGDLPSKEEMEGIPANACPQEVSPANPFADPITPSSDPRHQAWLDMEVADQQMVSGYFAKFGKAIEAYERRLIPGPSSFDYWSADLRGEEPVAEYDFGNSEQRGLKFFIGAGQCLSCHFGPMLTDGEFHNVGLSLPEGSELPDEGRPDGIRKLRISPFNGRGTFSDAQDWDSNQHLLYMFYNEHTFGAYKTPSLRNVSRTAPYGHDGRFPDLRSVLEFYSELPGLPPIGHREETLLPLLLGEEEMDDLLAFLMSLEGAPIPAPLRTLAAPER